MMKKRKTLQPANPLVDYAKYQMISDAFQLGWWEIDLSEDIFSCSASVAHLLKLDETTVSVADIFHTIREDYRQRIMDLVLNAVADKTEQYTFPAKVGEEIIWLSMRFQVVADQKIMGMLTIATESEKELLQKKVQGMVKNFIYQLNGVSSSLFSFLERESFDQMVNHILHSFMTHFNAERSYLMTLDRKKKTSTCVYEVVSRPGLEEIDTLADVPYEADDWWFGQLFALRPVAISVVDDMPDESESYRELLSAQHIQSLLVVPLVSSDKEVWGFAGIDLVDTQRNWTAEDIQWFSALMNIINICIELQKSKIEIEADKKYLEKLHKYMPIGYVSERIIYNEAGEPVDFVYLDFNKEMEKIVGKPLSHMVGRKGSETGTFGDFELLREMVNADSPIEIDVPLPQYGKYCRVVRFSIHKDEVTSLVMDITDIHEAHKALEKTIYSNMPVNVELYDKDGYLIYLNEADQKFLGIDNISSVLGINIYDHPSLSKEIMQKASQGESLDLSLKYDMSTTGNYYRKTLPSAVKDMMVKVVPIFDETQAIQNYLFMSIDNTETTNAYRRIQDYEDYFSAVANLAKIGYCRLNVTAEEGYRTAQWFANLGKPVETGLTFVFAERFSNLHPDDFLIVEDFYTNAKQGIAMNFEREIRIMKEGEVDKWLKCTFTSKLNPSNDQMDLFAISEDITDLKRMTFAKDRAEELNKLKSEFMANMSHEIRTPLNSIIGFSDILAEIIEDEEQKSYLSIIQRNNDLLLKLMSDILDLSKIESGTYVFEKSNEHVCKLFGEVMHSFNHRITNPDVKIKMDPLVADYHIYMDANSVKQVLYNFITNALKFTQEGTISIGCERIDENNLKFYVRDTGIGISPEHHDAVFDRFVKLDSFAQGTGLGLPICKSLIKEMGGKIGVDSELGKGSCFWFTLPMN
ncbi:ATP-binding protein [Parabacteroides sp. PF5-6]|uniref:ATP-binding protein n=1 Tax=Parabacteroides sp. PF5-6 TaxID=1742403 RepID=UPI002407566D|nr:ATP-binding protein [Parabacteroides sp. PF5-6]MDF9830774.1 signal transduction histidine kinase [Parabacteroides sp. PF5-6]